MRSTSTFDLPKTSPLLVRGPPGVEVAPIGARIYVDVARAYLIFYFFARRMCGRPCP